MVAFVRSLDDPALVDALEGNLWSGWSTLALGPGGAFHRRHGALMVETPVAAHPYNMVQHFVDEGDPAGQVDAVFAHFAERGVPFLWLLTPTSHDPDGLKAQLAARGFSEIEPMTGMATTLAPFAADVPPAIAGVAMSEIELGDVEEIHHFISARWGLPEEMREAAFDLYRLFRFGHPDAHGRFFIARSARGVVAKCLLHCGAGVAGIHGVATRPEARGRGIASALTRKALRAAHDDGYRVAVLHSTPMAVPVYAAMGFLRVAPFSLFGPGDDFHV